jgi:hypothetical protein
MSIWLGAAKGAVLGVLYSVIATPPFAFLFFKRIALTLLLLPMVAICSVSAGALVGAAAVVTRAYQPGGAWRAQLAMGLSYVLTGITFMQWLQGESLSRTLESVVMFSPFFVPLALCATWAAVEWIRAGLASARA